MVAPPDVINDRPPENPRFESDRDNTVEHETVNPGVPNPGPIAPPAPKQPAPPQRASVPDRAPAAKPKPQQAARPAPEPKAEPREAKRVPALDDLFLGDKLVQQPKPDESAAHPAPGLYLRRLPSGRIRRGAP